MKKHNAIVAGLAAIPTLGALPLTGIAAEGIDYTYLQAEYINLDIDDYGDGDVVDDFDNGDGIGFRGSLGFQNNFFIFADYSSTEADATFVSTLGVTQPADTDVKRLDLGGGFALPLANNADAVFRAAYVDVDLDEFEVGGGGATAIDELDDDDTDGFLLDAAWRGQVAPQWEIQAGARYTDIEEIDDFGVFGSALFEIDDNWGIDLRADVGDNLRTYSAGIRYTIN